MGSKEIKKSEAMRKKNEEIHRLFNLPETERVIQDYKCSLNSSFGKLFISQNYVCFRSGFKSRMEKIPFSKIVDIKEIKGLIFNGISIVTQTETYDFYKLLHRNETLELLLYLWKNVPQIVNKEDIELVFGTSESKLPADDEYSMMTSQERTELRLNNEISRKTAQVILETQKISANTLVKLSEQSEQLNRIETSLNNIESKLDKTERLISGMESVVSYIGNKFKKKKGPPVYNYKNKSLKVDTNLPPLDIEILCKNSDDSFTPSILRLHSTSFSCVDENGQPLKDEYHWSYYDIEKIVLRARPGHMDIRFFEDISPRFRLMSSYLQVITNELYLRSPDNQIDVIFEHGIPKFTYGDKRITRMPIKERTSQGNFFSREPIKTSSLLSDKSSNELKKDFDESDANYNLISNTLHDIKDMNLAMANELDEQLETLDRIERKVDVTNERLENQTRRMDKLMN